MDLTWDDFNDRTELQKVWDPAARRIVYNELPTLSKRAVYTSRASGALVTENLASLSGIGSGSAVRITAINIFSELSVRLALKDQSGTLRVIRLEGSTNVLNVHGTPKEPLHIARGGLRIGQVGTATTQELHINVEGYGQNAEVGYPHRGGR